MKSNNKARINAFISPKNYKLIDEIKENHLIGTRKLSKGQILDLALTSLFKRLNNGESFEKIVVEHYKHTH